VPSISSFEDSEIQPDLKFDLKNFRSWKSPRQNAEQFLSWLKFASKERKQLEMIKTPMIQK